VTLQISLAPPDVVHARQVVPHQVRQWGAQVDEILFTLDTHRIEGWYPEGWAERARELDTWVAELAAEEAKVRLSRVEYSPAEAAPVEAMFFGGRPIPAKDHTGLCPIYAYFHGLASAAYDHVLHLDSDLLFGGGSRTWISEATDLLERRPDVLFCAPMAGPPTADGEIPRRVLERAARWGGVYLGRDDEPMLAHRFGHVSSRLFFVDRARLVSLLAPIKPRLPQLRSRRSRLSASPSTVPRLVRARLRGRSTCASFEDLMSHGMREAGRMRLDFLGKDPGMWSLHPVARTDEFLRALPRLVERVEVGDVPDEQRGDYDLHDSLLPGASAPADVDA
jgi:hypothetical protein